MAGWFEPDGNGALTGEFPIVVCLIFIRMGVAEEAIRRWLLNQETWQSPRSGHQILMMLSL